MSHAKSIEGVLQMGLVALQVGDSAGRNAYDVRRYNTEVESCDHGSLRPKCQRVSRFRCRPHQNAKSAQAQPAQHSTLEGDQSRLAMQGTSLNELATPTFPTRR